MVEASLFRAEVFEYRRRRLYGDVVLTSDRSATYAAGALVILTAGVLTAAFTGTYARTETVKGAVVTSSPTTRVAASRAGTVRAIYVRDGDHVEAGQRLVAISSDARLQRGLAAGAETVAALDRQLELARSEQVLARRGSAKEADRLDAAIDVATREKASILRQIELQVRVAAASDDLLRRIEPIGEKGFVSQFALEQRRQDALLQHQRLEQLRQQETDVDAKLIELRTQRARLPDDAAKQQAELAERLEALQQEHLKAESGAGELVVAPISGQVTALNAAPGRSVDGELPLMSIVPERSPFEVELYAPSRAIGFIRPGQAVRIMYDAFPYRQFGSFKGHVTRISRTTIPPRDIEAALKIEEGVYRVRVAIDDQAIFVQRNRQPLQSGMTLTATVVLERRNFIDWLLAPVRAVNNRA